MILPVAIVDAFYNGVALPILQAYLWAGRVLSAKLRDRWHLDRQTQRSPVDPAPSTPRLWAHAASMGELEQLVPILERCKRARPDMHVTVTCTSPSGIRHARRLQHCIDDVAVLDVDTKRRARRWLDRVRPSMILIDRYDLWRNHTTEAHRRNVPIMLVNATMPSAASGMLRAWVADTYRKVTTIEAVTTQDATAMQLLTGRPVSSAPDTRFDRVMDRIATPDAHILAFRRPDTVTLVLGSSWRKDEDLVLDAIASVDFKGRCVIVPHEPTEDALRSIERRLPCTRWSVATASTTGHLVVDHVGALLSIYAIADAAWVGGGFIAGVHSLAEPAAYGVPLACGPNIDRSRDARPLIAAGALHVCATPDAARAWLRDVVMHDTARTAAAAATRAYVRANVGTSDRIVAELMRRSDH